MDYYYNFSTVIERIPANIESIVENLYPNGKKRGQNWCLGNIDGEPGQSFQISLKPANAGCYIDRADPSISGNPIALVALAKKLNYQAAGEWLAKYVGLNPEERFVKKKNRPKPEIDKSKIKSLSTSGINYAKSRNIEEKTLRQLKLASDERALVMPHYDVDGNLVLIKYWPTDGSKNVWTNTNPIHTLFGKELIDPIKSGGRLIITEGHWDAMSWIQLGYPAVSIPSGVDNDSWIEEDWTFLNLFTEIYLDYDNDAAGRNAEARVKTRLGYDRCKAIRYEFKDANEALQLGRPEILEKAFIDARDAPVEHIVKANEIKHIVKNHLSENRESTGVPFFIRAMRNLEFRPHESTLWYGHTGHGKALALDTIFPTTHGHKTMKELEIGDYVYGSDGQPTKIELTSPIFKDHECYEITFKDGLKVVADADHLWQLETFHSRMSKRARKRKSYNLESNRGKRQKTNDGVVMTTKELAGKPLRIQVGQTDRWNYSIPVAPAFAGVKVDLPVPPYTLGAWLGDGTSASGQITTHDDDLEIIDRIESEGFQRLPNKALYRYGLKGLYKPLRKAGLLGNKHIPEIYFNASKEQRMALLMGLMDTDGTISNGRQAELCTVKEDLAHQYQRLANGLGLKAALNCGNARLNGKVVSKKYRVQWTSSDQVFNLKRKADAMPKTVSPAANQRFIVSVKKVDSVPTKCISVRAENKLFLCTEHCLITHNSTALMNQFAYQASLGIPGMIASFEDNTAITYSTLLKQFSSNQYVGGNENYDAWFDHLTELIHLFDSMKRAEPQVIISTMTLAHKQLGICDFAVDNVMTLDVDRQDNTKQAEVADAFRIFVARYPVHVHLVAHPRKGQDANIIRPPQLSEVRGASEWGDMAQNAICVYRDIKKAERISEMYDEGMSAHEIMNYRQSCRDGKFIVRKQRFNGELPICSFQFESPIRRFWKDQEDRGPYWNSNNGTEST